MGPFIAALDARIFYSLYAAWDGRLTGLALALSAIGSGWSMLLLLPLYGVARWRRFAVSLTAALVSTTALVFVLKQVVARHRPCNALSGVHALCVAPTDPSFPSGHACGSFTFAVFVLIVLHAGADRRVPPWARWVLSVAVVVAAVSIAWSRVYLGVHFPGDVAGGAVLGTMMGALWGLRYVRTRPH